MAKTLDEFFDSYGSTRRLRENLETNMEMLGDDLSDDDKENLLRTNLIFIRECLLDFGAENG